MRQIHEFSAFGTLIYAINFDFISILGTNIKAVVIYDICPELMFARKTNDFSALHIYSLQTLLFDFTPMVVPLLGPSEKSLKGIIP